MYYKLNYKIKIICNFKLNSPLIVLCSIAFAPNFPTPNVGVPWYKNSKVIYTKILDYVNWNKCDSKAYLKS